MEIEVFRHGRRRSRRHAVEADARDRAAWRPAPGRGRSPRTHVDNDDDDRSWKHVRNRAVNDLMPVTPLKCEYGTGWLEAGIPAHRFAGARVPALVPPLDNLPAAIARVLDAPDGALPFDELIKPARSVLIVTVDRTRPSPAQLLRPLVARCARQNKPVTICISTGHHRNMSAAELDAHLGADITAACAIVQHDPVDNAIFVDRGRTSFGTRIRVNKIIFEHDVVVGAGFIEPTYLCGFSGGRKIIMPGLAHHDDIDDNHFLLLKQGPLPGRLDGNIMSEDCEEFVRGLPFHFILYSVINAEDETVAIVAGDPFKAHRAGCAISARIFEAEPIEADIVVTSPGGHPYDTDLVQAKKAILPAQQAVRDGGVIILAAACPELFGAEKDFVHWLKSYSPDDITRRVHDRTQFTLGVHGANVMAKPVVHKHATIIMVCCDAMHAALAGSFINTAPDLAHALAMATKVKGESSTVALLRKCRRLFLRHA